MQTDGQGSNISAASDSPEWNKLRRTVQAKIEKKKDVETNTHGGQLS